MSQIRCPGLRSYSDGQNERGDAERVCVCGAGTCVPAPPSGGNAGPRSWDSSKADWKPDDFSASNMFLDDVSMNFVLYNWTINKRLSLTYFHSQ